MKPKVFRDALRAGFIFIEILMLFLAGIVIFTLFWLAHIPIKNPDDLKGILLIQIIIGGLGGGSFVLGFFSPRVLPRAFGKLLVYKDKVVYKCPFRRTRVLRVEECIYIGIENYEKLNRGLPIVRGDETSFVYFSRKPYPKEYEGKITVLKNSKDFIKISYTDKLAEAVMETFPFEQCYLVKSFYGKMKTRDRALKKNKK